MTAMKKMSRGHLRTWLEIDRRALSHNYRLFRKVLGPKVKLMAVVKSNGYGHGLVPLAKLLARLGADWLGVDSVIEGFRLRTAGVKKPILVLGYTRPENFPAAARQGISLTVSTLETLKKLAGLPRAKQPRFHLKVDTGMHRQGFLFKEFPAALAAASPARQGIYSHLAVSGGRPAAAVQNQVREFERFLTTLGARPRLRHLAATGGALACPAARYDLVRIGLGLYGLWPNENLRRRFGTKMKLRPALVWKTIVSEIKTLPVAGRVGYDLTERVPAGTRLAVCPVGYWHGYPRLLSGRGRVRVRGQWARVVGRVSMDMLTIEVTKIRNIRPGDEVVLLNGVHGPRAEELARLAQTSNYEIITRLNPLIERFYL